MASQAHSNLSARIEELVEEFVDFDIPLDRGPIQSELDKIAAFKLLSHSEIETFLEERFVQTIQESIASFVAAGKANRCLLFLGLRWLPRDETSQHILQRVPTAQDMRSYLEDCRKKSEREAADNNGVKGDNIKSLAYSAGVQLVDEFPALHGMLDRLGVQRGDVAHKSIGKVNSLNDPRSEASNMRQLILELQTLDEHLLNLL
ncbi:hypothetical protein [Devosia sp.]|uniref:hypothetical protein n=1 Tax=Devosia sp. TaxID=1871048 RepID=UPI001AC41A14|nr:hypothetical protein [Devosia sp.]MBN9335768.1 hypothetical protein [Devosia sp.]